MSTVNQNSKGKSTMSCRHCTAFNLCKMALVPRSDGQAPEDAIIRRHRKLKKGDKLFRAGDVMHSLSVVCEGSVKSQVEDRSNDAHRVIGVHIPGEVVGLEGLLERKHHTDAVALSDTSICEILLSRLDELVHRSQVVQRDWQTLLLEQMQEHNAQLTATAGRMSAAQRLASYMCFMSDRFTRRGQGSTQIEFGLSRGDLGNYLGLAKETISRLLTRFEEEGLVVVKARRAQILKPGGLQAVADGVQVV